MPESIPPVPVTRTPRVLWVELTSRCPFDCIFCSRKTRRGAGGHMPLNLYAALIGRLQNPRTVVLNYSGESTLHPDLIPAIGLARAAGAFVELVSAFATVPHRMLEPLAASGLGRLTVSLHATDPRTYQEIYRYSSITALNERLESFAAICKATPGAPALDIGFVAMQRNLDQLAPVAEFGASIGVSDILLFPVMRRDEIPVQFPGELSGAATPTDAFRGQLRETVERARQQTPQVRFTICNPTFELEDRQLGQVPRPYPWPLPEGAKIHTCEQNPFETVHVLSTGDVVACEVLDHVPLGNLHEQPLETIWNGEAYRHFRERYQRAEVPECRNCVWKRAYQPAPLESSILASRGGSAQLQHGWHDATGDGLIWSTQEAAAVLKTAPGSTTLHVSGVLPPGPNGEANELAIRCGAVEIGRVSNPWEENMPFGLDFPVPGDAAGLWQLSFSTSHVYRARERGVGSDQRDLGFALVLAASKRPAPAAPSRGRQASVERARQWIGRADWLGHRSPKIAAPSLEATHGVSILIPERDNPDELKECLAGASLACREIDEPVEIVVVANGAAPSTYDRLRSQYRQVKWIFRAKPLGFTGAIRLGLDHVRHGWTYLLNNDAAMQADTLSRLLPLRSNDLFAAGSQIFFKDPTRFREETNLTALLLEEGLAAVHDLIPESNRVAESFYTGGGASLFRTGLLRRFVRDSGAYAPFYWEDVEWGWRARKLGFQILFCPDSVVYHRHRATIGKFHSLEEIEAVLERNRLLFQLRNLTGAEFTARALEAAAQSSERAASRILSPGAVWGIARSRVWNHRAPVQEETLLAGRTVS
ncbi:MAG: glycosyltransferase [Bryobacteraceae bacterium]|nr:glycosyltransferase [Bryobacteraceae bacterium]